ncbi:hypothetical protein ACS0TY_035941 [Phlomoides rotata]
MEEINLSNNSFSGGISHFLCDMSNQTYRLVNLDIGRNQLTGEIPDCWMKWPSLSVVNLGDNNFSGGIPNSLGVLKYMLSLNLYDNKLSGQIPVSLSNCTELVKVDLSGNNLVGNIPTRIGTSLAKWRFMILRSNKLRGRFPSRVNNFTAMTIKRNLSEYIGGDLDFSSFYFGNFLESASVATKERENHYDTFLSLVNVIDLSDNNLSGGIPEELTSLVELISLNLSGNHLTGSIPESIGDMRQLDAGGSTNIYD